MGEADAAQIVLQLRATQENAAAELLARVDAERAMQQKRVAQAERMREWAGRTRRRLLEWAWRAEVVVERGQAEQEFLELELERARMKRCDMESTVVVAAAKLSEAEARVARLRRLGRRPWPGGRRLR